MAIICSCLMLSMIEMMQRGVVALVDLDDGDASLMISRHVEQRLAWSMMWMRLFLALER
jgi:hypothetical protein